MLRTTFSHICTVNTCAEGPRSVSVCCSPNQKGGRQLSVRQGPPSLRTRLLPNDKLLVLCPSVSESFFSSCCQQKWLQIAFEGSNKTQACQTQLWTSISVRPQITYLLPGRAPFLAGVRFSAGPNGMLQYEFWRRRANPKLTKQTTAAVFAFDRSSGEVMFTTPGLHGDAHVWQTSLYPLFQQSVRTAARFCTFFCTLHDKRVDLPHCLRLWVPTVCCRSCFRYVTSDKNATLILISFIFLYWIILQVDYFNLPPISGFNSLHFSFIFTLRLNLGKSHLVNNQMNLTYRRINNCQW